MVAQKGRNERTTPADLQDHCTVLEADYARPTMKNALSPRHEVGHINSLDLSMSGFKGTLQVALKFRDRRQDSGGVLWMASRYGRDQGGE